MASVHNPEREKANREYYRAQGRCYRCGGKRPLMPGKALCEHCYTVQIEGNRRRIAYRKANRLCRMCGKPLGDSKTQLCAECHEKGAHRREVANAKLQEKRHKRKEEGKCVECGIRWAEPGKTRCQRCLDRKKQNERDADSGWRNRNERRAMLKAQGRCIDCGRKSKGFARCFSCRGKRLDSQRKYVIHQKTIKAGLEWT